MSDLVQSHQYPVPEEQLRRREDAVQVVWTGFLVLAIFVIATIYVGFTASRPDVAAMLALTVLPASAICGWAIYWYRKNSRFRYNANGIQVVFQGPEYYVPQDKMERLVSSVYHAWDHLIDDPKNDVYDGVLLEIKTQRPVYPLDGEERVGITWHQTRHSQVWGPYALSLKGAAYHLLLHGAEHVWESEHEGVHAQMMQRHGVLDRIQEALQENDLE